MRVLITGAGSGIGLAVLEELASAGHEVVGTARSLDKCRRMTSALVERGIPCRFEPLEFLQEGTIDALLTSLESSPIDVLVNNAGYGEFGPIEELGAEAIERQYRVNLIGPLQLTQRLLPGLRERRGTIVWIGSLMHYVPLPFQGHYAASKAALAAVSDAMRIELEPFGVRVVCVEPGDYATDFTANRVPLDCASSIYRDRIAHTLSVVARDEKAGPPGSEAARKIVRFITNPDPPPRAPIGNFARSIRLLSGILPDRLRLFILRRLYDPPRG